MNLLKSLSFWLGILLGLVIMLSVRIYFYQDNEKRMTQYIEKSKLYRDYTDILEIAGDSMFISNWWVLVEGRLGVISELDSLEKLIITK
jgi:hypothetical protein